MYLVSAYTGSVVLLFLTTIALIYINTLIKVKIDREK